MSIFFSGHVNSKNLFAKLKKFDFCLLQNDEIFVSFGNLIIYSLDSL